MPANHRLSIVIPCYKAAGTIVACLDSIAVQTFDGFEVIVVDDCSPDDSVDVVRKYSECHPNVRLLRHEVNGGVSKSRNDGIKAANGDYVMFVDADDTLERDCCAKLMEMAMKHTADCVSCNALVVSAEDTKEPLKKKDGLHVFKGADYAEWQYCAPFFDMCWAKVYRRAFLVENHLEFDETLRYGEDTLFANCAALEASTIVVDSDYCGYNYVVGAASAYNTTAVQVRLAALARLLEALRDVSGGNRRILLRKSLETLWTIRKHGGDARLELVRSLVGTPLWREIVYPTIQKHGKLKHRLLARMMNCGISGAIRFW